MQILLESLEFEWQNLVRLAPRLIAAVVLLLLLIWIGRLVGRFIAHVLGRRQFRATHTRFFRGLTAWLFGLFGLIVALNVLGLRSLAASPVAGLVSPQSFSDSPSAR